MDYKEPLIPSPSGSSRQAQRSWPTWKILVASALATVALWCTTSSRSESRAPVPPPKESGSGDWRWTDFAPSRSIKWHPCYNGELDCARLDLPMDWLEPSDDERVILALARLRAKDREDYRGPVIFNPGGPGGSGVWSLVDHGKYIQSIVGTNFDIVTFDPRGVGASVPRIECWETEQARSLWNLQAPGTIDSHPGVLSDVFARASAFSQTCERTLNKSGILRHSATASHAADLLQITKGLGEEKIKFWGFSYGTILAGAFAAMYPERVDRIVSDGNVDYREWFLREHINFLQDTDKVMEAFYELCIEAGPVRCPMYDRSPVSIRRRIEAILEDLQKNPIVVAPSDEGPLLPQLITFSKIKAFISTSLYRPFHTFELLAKVLAVAEKRDGRALYEIFKPGDMLSLCAVETVPPTVPPDTLNEGTADVFSAVLCADTPQMNDTLDDFAEYAEAVQKMSYSAGAVNAVNRMGCVSRHIRPKWRVAGPFNANTSYPILFVNNIADNITPLISARNNSQSFPGSVLLIQNSYGHTSLSTPSTCTARAIRAYFQNGTLPQADSVCEPDGRPFNLPAPLIVESQGDEITLAVQELSRKATFEFQARLHGLL